MARKSSFRPPHQSVIEAITTRPSVISLVSPRAREKSGSKICLEVIKIFNLTVRLHFAREKS